MQILIVIATMVITPAQAGDLSSWELIGSGREGTTPHGLRRHTLPPLITEDETRTQSSDLGEHSEQMQDSQTTPIQDHVAEFVEEIAHLHNSQRIMLIESEDRMRDMLQVHEKDMRDVLATLNQSQRDLHQMRQQVETRLTDALAKKQEEFGQQLKEVGSLPAAFRAQLVGFGKTLLRFGRQYVEEATRSEGADEG